MSLAYDLRTESGFGEANGTVVEGKVALMAGGERYRQGKRQSFPQRSAALMVADVNIRNANYPAQMIRKNGGKAAAVLCGVTDKMAVQNMVAKTIKHFGRLDCALNNVRVTLACEARDFRPDRSDDAARGNGRNRDLAVFGQGQLRHGSRKGFRWRLSSDLKEWRPLDSVH